MCALFICMELVTDPILKMILFFSTRTVINTLGNLLWTFTSEAYPTQVRSAALGTCNGVSRGLTTLVPFIALPLYEASPWTATLIFAALNAATAFGAWKLPFDTKGRELQDDASLAPPTELQ